ncbi:transglycosylase domain-containing protein [Brachybacterium epidermidis]|uniref:transglycosylase domain-containing protein n=1 Tax=Brachybacterium epidermidis TaxID=2781983 RepID=UPI002545FA8F|nr:transglycosylase domain-containing protein [Brachybacterium epidermidis]
MSESRRSTGARRAAGVRRATGSGKPGKRAAAGKASSSGATTGSSGPRAAGRTSVGARHARPGAAAGGGKPAAAAAGGGSGSGRGGSGSGRGSGPTGPGRGGSGKGGGSGKAGGSGRGRSGSGRGGRGKKVAATNVLNYPRAGAKNPWRWIPSLRMIVGAMALFVIAGLGFAVWLYNDTEVPAVDDIALAQTSRVYFADNETEMGQFSEINRTIIPNDEIPENVKDAVVASEDSSFYENRGVSPRGIVRAVINNLSGNARQGGSTITMQYVERYHTGTQTSYVGKAKEAILALKIDQELSKDEILSRYLNTIYFGRGAYGVQEAAQAYFDKDAVDLTDEEAALLVAVIPAPSSYDPAEDPERAEQLWTRVIERRVNATGGLSPEEADAMVSPETIPPGRTNALGGTNGYLLDTVRNEMLAQGMTEDQLNTGGFRIVSTIDPRMQEIAVSAVDELPEDRPERNRVGTLTVDPSTGAIRSMYGGPDFVQQAQNDATQSRMQAGSIFKTFTLIAALEDGYPLHSRWDGNAPKEFPQVGWTVNNFNDLSYGRVSLERATTNSINTAYAEVNLEIGPERTQETAIKLGLPENTPGLGAEPSNVLGSASPTVREMAEVYATVAAGGVHRPSYIVQTVHASDGTLEYEHEIDEQRVLDEQVAINATVGLQGPPTRGSARSLQDVMGSPGGRQDRHLGVVPVGLVRGLHSAAGDGRGHVPALRGRQRRGGPHGLRRGRQHHRRQLPHPDLGVHHVPLAGGSGVPRLPRGGAAGQPEAGAHPGPRTVSHAAPRTHHGGPCAGAHHRGADHGGARAGHRGAGAHRGARANHGGAGAHRGARAH